MSTTASKGWRWRLFSSLLASLSVASAPLQAQTPAVHFQHLSVEDGLSHSTVWDVHQDRRGFLWFATGSELNRYDGHQFKAYRHDPDDSESLSGSEILVIHEDRGGDLWFGTRGRGLNRFDPSQERFERFEHDPEDPLSLLGDDVWAMLQDRSGTLWLGTDAGLSRFHPERTFTRYRHDSADPDSLSSGLVSALLEDRHGTLWVGTWGGLDRHEPGSEVTPEEGKRNPFVHYRHDPTDPRSIANDAIGALHEDSRGRLWVGTLNGLCRYDRTSDSFIRYQHDPAGLKTAGAAYIPVILEARAGEQWIGTHGDGLYRATGDPPGAFVHYRHDADDPYSLSSDDILDIHQDRTGILWFATRDGVNKYDPRREQFNARRPCPGREGCLSGSRVRSVTEDREGVVWVGTIDGGLTALDRGPGQAVGHGAGADLPDGLSSAAVTSLLADRAGELWVGTRRGGLYRLDRARRRITHYRRDPEDPLSLAHESVYCLLEDRSGQLWIGSRNGVQRFDRERRSLLTFSHDDANPLSLSSDDVFDLFEDRAGDLWVATFGGLNHLGSGSDSATDRFNRYLHQPNDPNSLSSDDVTSVLEDDSGILWIGTYSTGLNRLDRARGEFRSFRQKDGLVNDKVVGVIGDDRGDLWISTSKGLSRFDPRSETFRSYDADDGLHGNVFYIGSAYRSSRGEIFFGGTGGLTSFFPDRIADDPLPPPVMLTELMLLNQPVPLSHRDPASPLTRSITDTDELRLTHRHKVVGLEFAALHYASPRKNLYAYRLEGFDDDWVETDAGKRFAQYTNLDPGQYVFRVKAANKDGVWNEEGASVRIKVLPPPWKTWWAYSLYTLALATVVLGYLRSHRMELRRERQISRRLRDVDRLKDEFLANTSHELRTPLYGITGLAESLIDGAAGEVPEAVKANLAMIAGSGRRLGQLVNDILDYSRLTHESLKLRRRPVDLRPLAEVVLTLQRPLAAGKDLELRNAVARDLPAADADEARLEQILHNLVGNAVKFTEEGHVEISATIEQGMLVVIVEDTGIGIAEGQRERIFEAFEQADSGIQRAFGGTGLGLTVTRELVELHGGRIQVESTSGEGTRFAFTLPISDQTAEPKLPSEPSVSRLLAPLSPAARPQVGSGRTASPAFGDRSRPGLQTSRILVVDDEPVILQVLSNQLASEGYDVELAATGSEALRLMKERTFDLVVLDVMMPRMSGYEVCRALRQRHSLEDLPVIFLTAKNQVPDLVAGLAAGGNDYLAKPIGKDELLARVRTHLELLSVHRRLETKNAELARFNYTVAHDLRNPLTTIKNFLGLVRRDAASGRTERLERDLDRLDTAADKLERLLDELFELSRVGVQANPPEDVLFGDLVREARLELAGPIAERGVEVTVAPDLPVISGDRVRLLEAVRHLLTNAVQYLGDQGSPRIEVGVRNRKAPDLEPLTFYVRDNGMGIERNYHEKVFGLFERLDPEGSEGTGIGLALVKRIVEVHGGRIWVESEGKGQGSTFCFTLPRQTSQVR